MLIIQFWCKDGNFIRQIQGNVLEIYMQSLCKIRYMPLEMAVGLYISPQVCIDILLPKHILVHLFYQLARDLHMQIRVVLLTGQ